MCKTHPRNKQTQTDSIFTIPLVVSGHAAKPQGRSRDWARQGSPRLCPPRPGVPLCALVAVVSAWFIYSEDPDRGRFRNGERNPSTGPLKERGIFLRR